MTTETFFPTLVFGFKSSDRVVVYLKVSEANREWAVKVMSPDGTKTTVKTSYSLSDALRELAETIAQYTGGFTSWSPL